MLMTASALMPSARIWAEERTSLIINDADVGDDINQFHFSAGWVHEGGYPSLFEGGDEHWTTKKQFGDTLPSFSMTFLGDKITLYGHRTNEGCKADVFIDGEKAGEIDYYRNGRLNKDKLFESELLEEGEHTIQVVLTGERSESAGTTLEAAVDYAVVEGTRREFDATSITLDRHSLSLEEGMQVDLHTAIGPSYATRIPEVVFESSDPAVASVDEEGHVKALSAGEATITATLEGTQISDACTVSVREAHAELFYSTISDENYHGYPSRYLDSVEDLYNEPGEHEEQDVMWKNDVFSSRIDFYTKGEAIEDAALKIDSITDASGKEADDLSASLTWMHDVTSHSDNQQIFDVITHETAKTLDPMSMQAAWLSVSSSPQARAGTYTIQASLESQGQTLDSWSWQVEVQDLELPELDTQMELWMYPYSANRYYSGKSSEEYFGTRVQDLYNIHLDPAYDDALGAQLDLYREIGGDAITVTVVEDAWNHQCHDPYPSMVKWNRKADGTFTFDYTDLDKWVQMNLDHGIDGQIKSFSMSCWGNRITYFDEASGTIKTESPATGSERWVELWSTFMQDYADHMTEKGWFDKTYMAMDERPLSEVEPVLDLVESIENSEGKSMKTAIAVYQWDIESVMDRIDDLSLSISMAGDARTRPLFEKRAAEGKLSTLYTCGAQNSAMLNQPGESADSLLRAWKCRAQGLLRWALDSFNADPLTSSVHTRFVPGDLYLFYPSAVDGDRIPQSSPRYEKLMEGNRMVQKLKVLQENYPFLSDVLEEARSTLSSNITTASAQIADYSQMALDGTADPHLVVTPKEVSLQEGESLSLNLSSRPADYLDSLLCETESTINDGDAAITWTGKWTVDHGFPDLFVGGDDHWAEPKAEEAAATGYEFDFEGSAFVLKGNLEYLAGIFSVEIDGETVGEGDAYGPGKTRFATLYRSPVLEEGKHHVVIRGTGRKNAASTGYNMQLDSIDIVHYNDVLWTSSDPAVCSVENGTLKALQAGSCTITVSVGADSLSIPVEITRAETAQVQTILLEQAVNEAERLQTEETLKDLHPTVRSYFETSLEEAKAILADENASQQQVNDAWLHLVHAIHLLEFKADKTALEEAVKQAEAIDLNQVQEGEEKEEFLEALKEAREVLERESALNPSIEGACQRLEVARNALVYHELDVSLLAFLVEQTGSVDLSLYGGTEEEKQAFVQALETARAVLENPDSQQQIDEAASTLNNAWLKLRLQPDEELLKNLQQAYVTLCSLDLSLFSAQETGQINQLKEAMNELLDQESPDPATMKALLDTYDSGSIQNLIYRTPKEKPQEKNDPTPDQPEHKDAALKLETPQSVQSTPEEKASPKDKSTGANSVKTAAGGTFMALAAMAGAALAGLGLGNRKRRK